MSEKVPSDLSPVSCEGMLVIFHLFIYLILLG